MPRKLAAYLWDLKMAVDSIEEFTQEMVFEDFEQDSLTVAAVERKIEILGEALRQMLEHYPSEATFVESFTPLIVFQDYLLHQYARVNRHVLWDVVHLVPELRARVAARWAELGLDESPLV